MKNQIGEYFRLGVLCVSISWLASCTTDEISYRAGEKPDKDALETVAGTLRSSMSLQNRIPVSLTEGDSEASDAIYFQLNQPALQAMVLNATFDAALVDDYNTANKTTLKALPAGSVTLANGGKITVAAGTRMSSKIGISFSSKGLEPGIYLLPVVLDDGTKPAAKDRKVIYYGVSVRDFDETNMPLDKEWTTIFYVNTSEAQPMLADFASLRKEDAKTFKTLSLTTIGNIINLRIVQLDYDAGKKRAVLALSSDMRYVLEHADTRLRPMQDKGRKLCICIQGGGKGLGFCNMTDTQIADFVDQVKTVITTYRLDGVNLWDEGAGYGKAGMPEMNTTSYPKLIKALREAMPDKLLTLSDKGDPTAYFDDIAKMGGIEVGKYLDYAWHYYASLDVPVVFVNPYNASTSYTQAESRKPIAGLPEDRYGNVVIPCYSDQSENGQDPSMELWCLNMIMWGAERTNNILVFDDLALAAAVDYEVGYLNIMGLVYACLQDYNLDDFSSTYTYMTPERIPRILRRDSNYSAWDKNW